MDRISHYRKTNDTTGDSAATAPAHLIGHDELGRRVYQSVGGYCPVTNCNVPADHDTDADGNWVEKGPR